MKSKRNLQLSSLIQRVLADIFQKEGRSIYGNAFVTISGVDVSSDLMTCRCYISIFGGENQEDTLELIRAQTSSIKNQMARAIRNKVRRIPEIMFELDSSLDEVFKMEKLFDELDDAENEKA